MNRDKFSEKLHEINNVSLITLGLSAGYGYTYVLDRIIFSTALNTGFGVQRTNYEIIEGGGHTLYFNPALSLNLKAALRYDQLNFFSGIMATYHNNYALNAKLFNAENYMGKIVLFVGYRFNVKQNGRVILRKLGLVDYN